MKKIKLGTSPITGTIYSGKITKNNGCEMWIEKTDITDNAINAVFEHMRYMARLESKEGFYSYSYGDLGTMSFKIDKSNRE